MKTEIKTITPDTARELLKKNGLNRPLSRRHVNALKSQMLKGKWLFDGSPIKLNAAGQLLDGQHRLTALLEAEFTAEFVLISGIPTEAFTVMDTGKLRSATDSISIEVSSKAALIADVARVVLNYGSARQIIRNRKEYISNHEVYKFAMDNLKSINKSYDFCKKFKKPLISKSKLVALHLLFSRKSVTDADEFISKFCTGLALEDKSPVYLLRQKLIADSASKKKMDLGIKYALIIKCWNMYRKGETLSNVQLPLNTEIEIL